MILEKENIGNILVLGTFDVGREGELELWWGFWWICGGGIIRLRSSRIYGFYLNLDLSKFG